MPNLPYVNKVIDECGNVYLDLSEDTVGTDTYKVAKGETFHGSNGELLTGTGTEGVLSEWTGGRF